MVAFASSDQVGAGVDGGQDLVAGGGEQADESFAQREQAFGDYKAHGIYASPPRVRRSARSAARPRATPPVRLRASSMRITAEP